MNKFGKVILGSVIALGLTLGAVAGTYDTEVAKRIGKVGSVCVEGADCATATASTTMAAAGGGGTEANYKKSCATCHAVGIAGAPKLGDKAAWEPRLAKGMDVLYDSGLNGLAPGMPAKGMCFTCSDQEINDLVDYMVDSVK